MHCYTKVNIGSDIKYLMLTAIIAFSDLMPRTFEQTMVGPPVLEKICEHGSNVEHVSQFSQISLPTHRGFTYISIS